MWSVSLLMIMRDERLVQAQWLFPSIGLYSKAILRIGSVRT